MSTEGSGRQEIVFSGVGSLDKGEKSTFASLTKSFSSLTLPETWAEQKRRYHSFISKSGTTEEEKLYLF